MRGIRWGGGLVAGGAREMLAFRDERGLVRGWGGRVTCLTPPPPTQEAAGFP